MSRTTSPPADPTARFAPLTDEEPYSDWSARMIVEVRVMLREQDPGAG